MTPPLPFLLLVLHRRLNQDLEWRLKMSVDKADSMYGQVRGRCGRFPADRKDRRNSTHTSCHTDSYAHVDTTRPLQIQNLIEESRKLEKRIEANPKAKKPMQDVRVV